MRKITLTTLMLACCFLPLFAQGYDDERTTFEDIKIGLIMGVPVAIVGFLLMNIKAISGFGKVVFWIGIICSGAAIAGYILQLIGDLLTATLSLAWKLVIIGAALFLVYFIIVSVYDWLKKL